MNTHDQNWLSRLRLQQSEADWAEVKIYCLMMIALCIALWDWYRV